jgi:hypothetical protein
MKTIKKEAPPLFSYLSLTHVSLTDVSLIHVGLPSMLAH